MKRKLCTFRYNERIPYKIPQYVDLPDFIYAYELSYVNIPAHQTPTIHKHIIGLDMAWIGEQTMAGQNKSTSGSTIGRKYKQKSIRNGMMKRTGFWIAL